MRSPPQSMHDLAGRLLEVSRAASREDLHDAAAVIEVLREPLIRFIGNEGFASLLRRSLVLASADVPNLRGVEVSSDGCLRQVEPPPLRTNGSADGVDAEASVAIAAHFLGLLVTFVGERLTTRLVQQAWPNLISDENDSGTEDDR